MSFKSAIDKAVAQGFVYDKLFLIDRWEFIVGAPRESGLFPVIYHSKYKPKGFGL